MNNISGFGVRARLVASATFPSGITITEFADDTDPLDVPQTQIADKAMGLNGTLVTWNKAAPLPITIAVIPGSEADKNLAVLAEANRVGQGKQSAGDIITLTVIYPDGSQNTYVQGVITDAPLGTAIASAGRKKSKSYVFAFENKNGAN